MPLPIEVETALVTGAVAMAAQIIFFIIEGRRENRAWQRSYNKERYARLLGEFATVDSAANDDAQRTGSVGENGSLTPSRITTPITRPIRFDTKEISLDSLAAA